MQQISKDINNLMLPHIVGWTENALTESPKCDKKEIGEENRINFYYRENIFR